MGIYLSSLSLGKEAANSTLLAKSLDIIGANEAN
jgi:hypothetical protein